MTGAWAQGNLGRHDVLIAYIEGGVNYYNDGVKDALDNIYLNRGELPYPEGADGHGRHLRPQRRRPLRHPRLRAGPAGEPALPGRHAPFPNTRRARPAAASPAASTSTSTASTSAATRRRTCRPRT